MTRMLIASTCGPLRRMVSGSLEEMRTGIQSSQRLGLCLKAFTTEEAEEVVNGGAENSRFLHYGYGRRR